ASGEVATAFSFDGSSWATVPGGSPSSLNITGTEVALDGWINPSVNGNAIYFGKTQYGHNDYLLYFHGTSGVGGLIKSGGTELVIGGSYVPPLNQWTHLALTYDGTSMKLYINGVLNDSAPKSGNIDGDNVEFAIGGRADPNDHLFFTGKIDEVEVFDRALSQAEIQAIYNAGSAGKCNLCAN